MKKWCTYSAWGKRLPSFIGQLTEQSGNSGKIRYAENQLYSEQWWDMDYVEVFDSLEEAIFYLLKNGIYKESINQIKENFNFPSYKDFIDWNQIN